MRGWVFESLREEAGFCGIVFWLSKVEGEKESGGSVHVASGRTCTGPAGHIVGLKVWLLMPGRVNLAWCGDGCGAGMKVGVSVAVEDGGGNSIRVF